MHPQSATSKAAAAAAGHSRPPRPERVITGEVVGASRNGSELELGEPGSPKPVSITNSHDFAWSGTLWRAASMRTLRVVLVVLIAYVVIGIIGFHELEEWTYLDSAYFLVVTFTTVGYGDLSPVTSGGRAFAAMWILLGISAIGFTVSFLVQFAIAQGQTNAKEVIEEPESTGKKGEAERFEKAKVRRAGFKRAAYIRIVKCAIRLVVLFCVGTAVFTFGFEWKWDDALWYTVVTCSTVGYGDILPTTDNEKVAAMVIILVGTVTVTQALGEFVDLYVVIFTEEKIISLVLDSVTYVYKADVAKNGKITEAEYTIFKLQQMQKVDGALIERILWTFRELDRNDSGKIEIGDDIPAPPGWKIESNKEDVMSRRK